MRNNQNLKDLRWIKVESDHTSKSFPNIREEKLSVYITTSGTILEECIVFSLQLLSIEYLIFTQEFIKSKT